MKASEYAENINNLNTNMKLYFYELLAHNLTISIRAVLANTEYKNNELIEQIKEINEILHRVTSKIKVERLSLHEWPEHEVIKMINRHVSLCPTIGDEVANAIQSSYDATINKITS